MKKPAAVLLLSLAVAALEAGPLTLHPLFTDRAVFQQGVPVPVWGTAPPGEQVALSFGGQTRFAAAGEDGRWMTVLEPLEASDEPGFLRVETEAETIGVGDILVGEVWVASGQSNMVMQVRRSLEAEETEAAARSGAFPLVRLFRVPVDGSDDPRRTVEASWSLAGAREVSEFSATAFYFAARLAEKRGVPVGVIASANGGTNAFSWINNETFDNHPAAATVREHWAAALAGHPRAMERYRSQLAEWRETLAAAREAGVEPEGRAPREPLGPDHVKRPAGHYNAMIAPLQPYAMQGVIWYQGEANSRPPWAEGYRDLMFALVEGWRADWAAASGGLLERRDFPFYLVQLPNYARGHEEGWPLIREQMLRFWEEGERTGMVVAIDVGEADDIHPRDKRPVGERLADFARAEAYGEDIVHSGPVYESHRVEGGAVHVSFRHAGSGLVSFDGEPLRHFEIAGADGRFRPARTEIEEGGLRVWSPRVPEPATVRYAWSANPEGINFGNAEGFPASPFRTGAW